MLEGGNVPSSGGRRLLPLGQRAGGGGEGGSSLEASDPQTNFHERNHPRQSQDGKY